MSPPPPPAHHAPGGGYRNPWPTDRRRELGRWAVLRWQWERWVRGVPPNPPPEAFPAGAGEVAHPRAPAEELRITWVGHSTFLLQVAGLNVLTDPVWGERASPLSWLGPRRLAPPGLPLDRLPPVDAVLLSHDHYDHLDEPTVRALQRRFGARLRWLAPLGFREWLTVRGIEGVVELDWWESAELQGPYGPVTATALPAQHWCARNPFVREARLWCSWALSGVQGPRVYFGADSGYFPDYPQIAEHAGPFDALLLPIGAYEPRWFMRSAHMNPEEAVQAYRELGGEGLFVPMHWGTFRLTDEDPLEPPRRTLAAWQAAGLPPERLWIPRHGETRVMVYGE